MRNLVLEAKISPTGLGDLRIIFCRYRDPSPSLLWLRLLTTDPPRDIHGEKVVDPSSGTEFFYGRRSVYLFASFGCLSDVFMLNLRALLLCKLTTVNISCVGGLDISAEGENPIRARHLEHEVRVMRHHHEFGDRRSAKDGMVGGVEIRHLEGDPLSPIFLPCSESDRQ